MRDFANSVRALRRHEIERIGLAWMNGVIDDDASLGGMTDVYDAIIDAGGGLGDRQPAQGRST